jgi:PAS domain S-box-containing protein
MIIEPTIKILLIEDNPDDFSFIREILEEVEDQFELVNAETLKKGLKSFDDGQYDVILLDLGLPDSNGFDTFNKVHKHAPGTALIILTGLRDEEIGNRAVKEGAQDYLVKGQIDSKLLFKSINYGIERNNLVLDLAQRESNLSALMENTTDSIWSTDIEGNLLTFNSKFQKLYKKYYGVELAEGIRLYDHIPADEIKLWETVNNRILRKERFSFEKVYESPGTSIYVEISVNPIISEDGSVMGASFFSRDITERKKTENSLRVTLEEKKMLLKEIHHRVKNNLMIISNLLYLQSSYIKDKESQDIFKESQNRARSMALIHERLYHSADLKRMDFGDYIRSLSTELLHTYEVDPGLIKLKINVEDIFLDINTAIPLGLIVNELVTNSLKHAFPEGNSGEINVDFHPIDDYYEFTVKDNGVGFPEDIDYQNTESLGLQIVTSLTDQIDGEITLDRNNGTKFKITFKELEV